MFLKPARMKSALAICFSLPLILAFQNCSKVNFAEEVPGTFKVAAEDTIMDISDPVPTAPASLPKDRGGKKDCDGEKAVAEESLVVECEMISSKQKIVLDQVLKKGSNASASRVCMSENACLKMMNAYAAKRGCQMTLGGSALQDSESQCTKIFPGSKGICHNANIVSDEKVAEVLDIMASATL